MPSAFFSSSASGPMAGLKQHGADANPFGSRFKESDQCTRCMCLVRLWSSIFFRNLETYQKNKKRVSLYGGLSLAPWDRIFAAIQYSRVVFKFYLTKAPKWWKHDDDFFVQKGPLAPMSSFWSKKGTWVGKIWNCWGKTKRWKCLEHLNMLGNIWTCWGTSENVGKHLNILEKNLKR